MNKTERFNLANDIEFYDACMNFIQANKGKGNPFQTIGDRARLVEELEKCGFTITRCEKIKPETKSFTVDERATIEVVNFDVNKSWIRWFLPDFADNGNIDLPKGNWKLLSRRGTEIIVERIETN